jgi:hypothetical protein
LSSEKRKRERPRFTTQIALWAGNQKAASVGTEIRASRTKTKIIRMLRTTSETRASSSETNSTRLRRRRNGEDDEEAGTDLGTKDPGTNAQSTETKSNHSLLPEVAEEAVTKKDIHVTTSTSDPEAEAAP